MDAHGNDKDFEEKFTRPPSIDDLLSVCRLLNREKAKYLVIGGMAVNHYGLIRGTHDIDLLVDDSPENMELVINALKQLPDGAASDINPQEIKSYSVIRINDEITVDLLAKACDVTYEEASRDIETDCSLGEPIPFISISFLIKTKNTIRDDDKKDRLFLESLLQGD